jgi:hypothetical protein
MDSLIYLLTVILSLAAWAGLAWIAWQGVELAYYIFCKITGRDY